MSKGKVLLIDDEPDLREILTFQVEELGYEADTASDGVEALEMIRKNSYLFIISDLDMPNMNGIELMIEVKKDYPLLPIAICSAKITEFAQQIVEIAVAATLPKPFTNENVEECVARLNDTADRFEVIKRGSTSSEPCVRDIMSSKVTKVAGDLTVQKAIETMTDYLVGALVIADGDTIQGIFTERDLLVGCSNDGAGTLNQPLTNVMTPNPVTIDAGATVKEANDLMNSHSFRHLPVTENGELTGIISVRDITATHIKFLATVVSDQTKAMVRIAESE